MARERKVFPRSMVAHLYVNASQQEAREPSGNFYFNGPTLFSYGAHYVIAHRYAPGRYVANADGYSNTTAKHRSEFFSAMRNRGEAIEMVGDLTQESVRSLRSIVEHAESQMREAANRAATHGKRAYAKRRADMVTFSERARSLNALATYGADDRSQSAADRSYFRKALAQGQQAETLAKDFWLASDNECREGEVTACAELDRMLGEEIARESLAKAVARVESLLQDAANGYSASYTADVLKRAVETANDAKATATKHHGLRAPRFDMPALIAARDQAQEIAYAEFRENSMRMMRKALKNCEMEYRNGGTYLPHYADVRIAAKGWLDGDMPRAAVAMLERCTVLRARMNRRGDYETIGDAPSVMSRDLTEAEGYATAGHSRDAVRVYKRAIAGAESFRSNCPQTWRKPQAEFAALADRLAQGVEYIANADALIARENARDVLAWREGRNNRTRAASSDSPMLRLSGDMIETSWGASVPASVAETLWRLVNAARAGMDTSRANGMRVGHFTLTNVHADGGITVGCHVIAYAELQRMALACNLARYASIVRDSDGTRWYFDLVGELDKATADNDGRMSELQTHDALPAGEMVSDSGEFSGAYL